MYPCRGHFWVWIIPGADGIIQQYNVMCHMAWNFQHSLEEHYWDFKILPWPPYFPDVNPLGDALLTAWLQTFFFNLPQLYWQSWFIIRSCSPGANIVWYFFWVLSFHICTTHFAIKFKCFQALFQSSNPDILKRNEWCMLVPYSEKPSGKHSLIEQNQPAAWLAHRLVSPHWHSEEHSEVAMKWTEQKDWQPLKWLFCRLIV